MQPIPDLKRMNVIRAFVGALIHIFDTGPIDYDKVRELSVT